VMISFRRCSKIIIARSDYRTIPECHSNFLNVGDFSSSEFGKPPSSSSFFLDAIKVIANLDQIFARAPRVRFFLHISIFNNIEQENNIKSNRESLNTISRELKRWIYHGTWRTVFCSRCNRDPMMLISKWCGIKLHACILSVKGILALSFEYNRAYDTSKREREGSKRRAFAKRERDPLILIILRWDGWSKKLQATLRS